MRVKPSYVFDLANTVTDVTLKFIKYIPQFILLPCLNQQALLLRNTRPTILFYAQYQLNLKPIQKLTHKPCWMTSVEYVFPPSTKRLMDEISYLVGQVSFIDPCLIQLILVILAFSTNNIDHDHMTITHQLDEYYHGFLLHKIQNMYVELMWKYMM
jgi:hypothetical protein